MTFFNTWWFFYPALYVWFARFWFKNDYEVSPWTVYFFSIFLCIPACILVLVYGTIFRVLDWASTRNG